MKNLITLLLILGSFISLQSRHIIGGTVDYTINSISGDQVDIDVTFHMYRDALSGGATFDQQILIGIYGDRANNVNNYFHIITRPASPVNIGAIDFDELLDCIPSSVSFESAEYKANFVFSLEDYENFTVSYQRCCRSETLFNIQDGSETGIAISVDLTRAGMTRLGNVKSFPNIFPASIGPNVEKSYDFSINDGLNRSYSLSHAKSAGGIDGIDGGDPESCFGLTPSPFWCRPPFDSVAYVGGLGEFGFGGAVSLDSISGAYTVDFSGQGIYLIAVESQAYKNEELLSTVYQQFVQVVTHCDPNSVKEEVGQDLHQEIYPVPTQDMIYIATPLSDIIIYDAKGTRLLIKSVFNADSGIDVSNFSAGVYFLEGNNTNGEKVIKRFIK